MTVVSTRFDIIKGCRFVVGVHAQENDRKKETEQFMTNYKQAVNRKRANYYLIISGDFNATVGEKEFQVLYVPLEKAG
jgi:hypothetical protein